MRSAVLQVFVLVGLLGACGGGTVSEPNPDAAADGPRYDAMAGGDGGMTDGGPPSDAPATVEAAASCPVGCPVGQIVVTWDLSFPGYPGSNGCACKPDPCPDAGVDCPCFDACQQVAPGGGCCNWAGTTLSCNACG
jgi:hypothetical protein